MRLKDKDLDKRLQGFSRPTLALISKLMNSEKTIFKMMDITTNSELSEEQVAEQLKQLLKESEAL